MEVRSTRRAVPGRRRRGRGAAAAQGPRVPERAEVLCKRIRDAVEPFVGAVAERFPTRKYVAAVDAGRPGHNELSPSARRKGDSDVPFRILSTATLRPYRRPCEQAPLRGINGLGCGRIGGWRRLTRRGVECLGLRLNGAAAAAVMEAMLASGAPTANISPACPVATPHMRDTKGRCGSFAARHGSAKHEAGSPRQA
jgi:hypothetical protein